MFADRLCRKVLTRLLIAGLCISAALLGVMAEAASPTRPNILLIITDQQHARMLGCAGNRFVKTPSLDRLAAEGVRFDRAYCANPVCIPSRLSMMTGVMPSRIGMEKNGHAVVPPALHEHSLGQIFKKHGYLTVYGGKVHLPDTKITDPTKYDFVDLSQDERGGLAEACAKFLHEKHDQPFLLVASFINPHDICYMAIDAFTKATGQPRKYPHSVRERACLAEALQLPTTMSRDEFFKNVCPPLPDNLEIPPAEPSSIETDLRGFTKYVRHHWSDRQWRLHRWAYARLTERVDRHIGRVLDALRDAGLEKNTVVVFTSDHGDMDAAHRLEHKSMPYEEATHVPLIVCHAGHTQAGRVDRTHLVSTGLDLIPTLCDFANIPVPGELTGRSIKRLAAGEDMSAPWRTCLVAENERSRVLWMDPFKYAVYDHGQPREMLVDLKADPGEMRNLAVEPEYHDILVQYRKKLVHWYDYHKEKLDSKYIVQDNH